MSKISCFVSYSHDDVEKEHIKEIINWIASLSDAKFEFLFDQRLICGDDFNEFMEKLKYVDVIFMLLSPSYKFKTDNRIKTSGAYKEFVNIQKIISHNERIKNNLLDNNLEASKSRVLIYPLLITGELANSVPKYINSLNVIDISDVFVDEEFGLDQKFKLKHKEEFIKIIQNAIAIDSLKTKTFTDEQKNLHERLFVETKSEYLLDLPEEIFVKTRPYNLVIGQFIYFLVGRKGTGKSTVCSTIKKLGNGNYKGIVSIIANEFNLEETYYELNIRRGSDLKKEFGESDTYLMFWKAYIFLFSMYIVYNEKSNLKDTQKKYIRSVISFFETALRINEVEIDEDELETHENKQDKMVKMVTRILYKYCLCNLSNFMDHIIENSRNDKSYLEVDIAIHYNTENFISYLIGSQTKKDFKEILKYCTKRILIALDGFDTDYSLFRKATNEENKSEYIKRVKFEALWLMYLMEVLVSLKKDKRSILNRLVDVCATIPMERFSDISYINKDMYKFQEKMISLNWSGIELANMITQRLEYIWSYPIDRRFKDEERLRLIWNVKYKNIPDIININISGKVYSVDLFLYLLRLSFWRPRDILRYYAGILALINTNILNDVKTDAESIKRIIKETSLSIIKQEFIGEFYDAYNNIDNVIESFRNGSQIISFNDLYKKINEISFYQNREDNMSFDNKIRTLYNMGFLGLILEQEDQIKYESHRYSFIFNEGQMPLSILKSKNVKNSKFIINCIFTEALDLQIDTNELVCHYSWEYLHKNHALSSKMNFIE